MHTIFNDATQMTEEQINAAIAEACGYECREPYAQGWVLPNKTAWQLTIPNYCTDLNAMHEAEKVLKSFQHLVNYHALLGYCGGTTLVRLHECITATARQRAEAFLRTLGKWEEGK